MNLDPFLAAAYKAAVLERRSTVTEQEFLVSAMKADPEMDKAVRAAAGKYSSAQGCFISKTHAKFLKEVLERADG